MSLDFEMESEDGSIQIIKAQLSKRLKTSMESIAVNQIDSSRNYMELPRIAWDCLGLLSPDVSLKRLLVLQLLDTLVGSLESIFFRCFPLLL